jgi:hypothetical protein
MSATPTYEFRKYLLETLRTNIAGDSDTYYIAIGRSEVWDDSDNVPTVRNSLRDERKFRYGMQSVKIAEDNSLVIPRVTWSSGTVYAAFDDNAVSHPATPYYVVTDDNQVYVCVQRGLNSDGTTKASTVKPTGTSTSKLSTADGYIWQYLYSIGTASSSKYLTANYMPIQFLDSADNPTQQAQVDAQNASISGEILNIVVTNGGSGYTSAPTVTIEGDGSGATATATVSGGAVKRIQMSSRGSGYSAAKISFSGGAGSGAEARAVLPPTGGLTANAVRTLRAKAILFNAKTDGVEGGDFIVENDFRQIAIIRNPTDYSGTRFTGNTGLALKSMIVSDASGFAEDALITGGTSGSIAIIDYVDSDIIYFHQNEDTGFGRFDSDIGGIVTSAGTNTTLTALIDSADVDYLSGDIIYLENRAAIIRSTEQIEDIKAIISL